MSDPIRRRFPLADQGDRKVTMFKVGDRVRYVRDVGPHGEDYGPIGHPWSRGDEFVVTAVRSYLNHQVLDLEAYGQRGTGLIEWRFDLVTDEKEGTEMKKLDTYKEKVRDRVIEEATKRGWCDEVDDFLKSIDLEPRDKPKEYKAGTVVRLNSGRRAVQVDEVGEHLVGSWVVISPDGRPAGGWWRTSSDINDIGIAEVLYEPGD